MASHVPNFPTRPATARPANDGESQPVSSRCRSHRHGIRAGIDGRTIDTVALKISSSKSLRLSRGVPPGMRNASNDGTVKTLSEGLANASTESKRPERND